ncbi:hypothetical protein SAMN06272783_0044 [Serratia sp. JKS296]|uniref:hypothetical protein n=1 Tax=Serratia sp. JKS296 TaxID=1938824 RepID=UPI000BDA87DB|nr:hypothetical protein [Serratia sp. JKS296]SOD31152.1 hypothetical protein SAMN06272783_0044 [Serratia sp. JKS296]
MPVTNHIGYDENIGKINRQVTLKLHNVAHAIAVSNQEEFLLITTPEGRNVSTPLTSNDVAELIDAYFFPVLKIEHPDGWQLVALTVLDKCITENALLSDFGANMWRVLIAYVAEWIDKVRYGDAAH